MFHFAQSQALERDRAGNKKPRVFTLGALFRKLELCLEPDPDATTPVTASSSWFSPPVLLRVDHIIIFVDVKSHIRRVGLFLFDTPAVAFFIANDSGGRIRAQSHDPKQAQGGYSYVSHDFSPLSFWRPLICFIPSQESG
jgi:hypothetical protein